MSPRERPGDREPRRRERQSLVDVADCRDRLSRSRAERGRNGRLSRRTRGTVVYLGELNAEALLARGSADDVDASLEAIRNADAIVVATPVYRRTYSGLLKALFDLFEPSALAGIPAVLAATAGHAGESLCIDHGLRPLIASLDGSLLRTSISRGMNGSDRWNRTHTVV